MLLYNNNYNNNVCVHVIYLYAGMLKISLAGANNSVPTTGWTPSIIIVPCVSPCGVL